jgi:hypothetical protein
MEQVLEYHGKITGDDAGEIAYRYGKMYGDAFTVIDCIGGTGDAALLTMMRLGYKNLYYDDPHLKNYTAARDASSISLTNDGRLPGFHSSSVRFQMLTNFAYAVKVNSLKIRSKRVIDELGTWIYKGDAGRIDHMDGCHDDTLTCLAMMLFVMNFSLKELQEVKKRDAVLLQAWASSASVAQQQPSNRFLNNTQNNNSVYMTPKQNMPFYSGNNIQTIASGTNGSYMWLFAKRT